MNAIQVKGMCGAFMEDHNEGIDQLVVNDFGKRVQMKDFEIH